MLDTGMVKNIELIGYVENPEEYMRDSKYIINSSRVEGFGLAIIEGMSCGAVPVIADHLDGPLEIINGGEFGHLFTLKDVDGSADLIISLMKGDLSWQRYSEAAVARSRLFTADQTEHQWKQLIEGFGL
jgi:glycosyltransferase involved in cell wall biosynthesis